MMDEIRLKIYGIRVTRSQFIVVELILLVISVAMLTILIYKDFTMGVEDITAYRENRFWIYFFTVLVIWIVVEAQFFLTRFVRTQLDIIRQQKEQIDLQNTEIKDSIRYARRIQDAVMTSEQVIRDHLPESFVFFKPRDIVSGDFFWSLRQEGIVYFAVADCTGHGVPGAMVSVMGNDMLNRSITELGITEPARILDQVSGMINHAFERSENEVKDGMDMVICAFDPDQKLLKFAGANNPLYLVREGELRQFKPDRQPVGKHTQSKPFTNQVIQLQSGDWIYLFSDGFADQFGGSEGKKYKYSRFRDFLVKIHSFTPDQQLLACEEEFNEWIGRGGGQGDVVEQIDDVCVMGVKFL